MSRLGHKVCPDLFDLKALQQGFATGGMGATAKFALPKS